MKSYRIVAVAGCILLLVGCTAPKIKLFPGRTDPLQEFVVSGEAGEKILVINIRGFISDQPKPGLLGTKSSIVEETVAHLRKAEQDDGVKAVLLKIDSPGGTVTASDILYNEIKQFRERTRKKIVVAMMGLAASGGYYISLPADAIVAHPTTTTGSIGVIFLRPKVDGLMNKIGVQVVISKSGRNKDMNSPFRESLQEEKQMMDTQIDALGQRFLGLVKSHRQLSPASLQAISTGRIFLAHEAYQLGLVDEVGYLEDALSQARTLAGLPENVRIIVYRRTEYPDDTLYNTANTSVSVGTGKIALIDLNLPELVTGFYYMWPAVVLSH
jgi:protease-4